MKHLENNSTGLNTKEQLVDAVLKARHDYVQTAVLSKGIPDLKKSEAFDFQFNMLEKELAAGNKQVGWKLGFTATKEAAKFNPCYGYILNKNIIEEGGTIPVSHFPGGSIILEAEVGFVMKEDILTKISSMKELIPKIDHVVGAIELAQPTAISPDETPLDVNYVIASGMSHLAMLKGNIKIAAEDFDFENECARCFINDTLVSEGISSNIFGSPLNALYHIGNMLLEKGKYIKARDLIITGSLYTNPIVTEKADIRVDFSTLGTLTFKCE